MLVKVTLSRLPKIALLSPAGLGQNWIFISRYIAIGYCPTPTMRVPSGARLELGYLSVDVIQP
jgi:hypothetical protein